ncbi:hypothetical protein [Mycolicibacterium elephantis]|uniref:Uncharacterized protein n=1 Tax=Mycolicibacterium elephantis DSM 44368 TaxID=1335622 RepID=A0A439DV81_9MYCO|nr:hypothetical protein [Mycolicibacterium elephantis]MCV7220820.1 hypothetical protein [Mycolicibacterium elephantis]RWA20890.1 hypothetical protein MELE44368_02755 [Mycolicibacterium elephantis DSM 44368]
MTKQFHIEDRAPGSIVATGEIDSNGLVVWVETEDSVSRELSDLAAGIQAHIADGLAAVNYDDPLEWFEL